MPRTRDPMNDQNIARAFVDEAQDRLVKQGYLPWLAGRRRVLDVGCGTGVLLDLLRGANGTALGIDLSPVAVAACRARGHEVMQGDAIELLQDLLARGEQFDAITIVHVIEHMDGEQALGLLTLAGKLLTRDGVLLLATPNLRNHIVLEETFWLDCTHVRPYPQALLATMCQTLGLQVIHCRDDQNTVPRRPTWKRVLAKMRSTLTGNDRSSGMDTLVVARRVDGVHPG